jgi:hypothetical protein
VNSGTEYEGKIRFATKAIVIIEKILIPTKPRARKRCCFKIKMDF